MNPSFAVLNTFISQSVPIAKSDSVSSVSSQESSFSEGSFEAAMRKIAEKKKPKNQEIKKTSLPVFFPIFSFKQTRGGSYHRSYKLDKERVSLSPNCTIVLFAV